MRRAEQEITHCNKICTIMDNYHCCHLGFNDNGEVQRVPMSFGYSYDNDKYTFYFHSAQEGCRVELMKQSPYICLKMNTNYRVVRKEEQ